MMKKITKASQITTGVILGIFFVAFTFLYVWQQKPAEATVFLKDTQLQVLVPKTLEQRHVGLGGRDQLEPYNGMLFIYEFPGDHGIVMRDMHFPIDIIWLDRGVVVDFAPEVQPEHVSEDELFVYRPRTKATMVLELPAGWASEHELRIGDKLTIVQ